MNQFKLACCLVFLYTGFGFAQQTQSATNQQQQFNHAVALYNNADYAAAQYLFNKLSPTLEKSSEQKSDAEFYKAFSAIKLNQFGAEDQMAFFIEQYPTSLKSATAYLEVGNYYFKASKYKQAINWYNKLSISLLTPSNLENLIFNKAYAYFILKNNKAAKILFKKLLNSKTYANQARYYFGYIAYADGDLDQANKYLTQVSDEANYSKNISYYLADINFKSGHFKKAITLAKPQLKSAKSTLKSELSKIIGESYFNLKNYTESVPYLLDYKGKNGKFSNTDYYLLGYAYYKLKGYDKAISWFNKIVNGQDAVAQNASYHLADCYLKTNNKTAALNAFRKASQMDFDQTIQAESYYNYAKLGYDIGNPYNNVAQVFINYLKRYPESAYKVEINQLLINAFMRSKDYKGALHYFKNASGLTQRQTYQKAAYYYGVQLFLEPDYNQAIDLFSKAIKVNLNNPIKLAAQFWRGEAYYRLARYNEAIADFKQLDKQKNAASGLNYNLAYAYFKIKDYQNAMRYFKAFINHNPSDKAQVGDSYLRLGDSYFTLSQYNLAINAFKQAAVKDIQNADYARYQSAISYGFLHQNSEKIVVLNDLINQNSDSRLFDDALLELGNTYLKTNQNKLALKTYDQLINQVKRSPFRAKALLKEGLIYYNQDQSDKALAIYKRLAKDFNTAPESRQAVKNAKQIYSDLGEIDQYENWIKGLSFVNETDEALDKAMYNSAEKLFLQNDFSKASGAFNKYLKRFPKGIYALQVNYYNAQSYLNLNKKDAAILALQAVLKEANNIYTEPALSKLALLYLEKSDWDAAMPLLQQLEQLTTDAQNKLFAQSNLMKAYFAKSNFDKSMVYAKNVLTFNKLDSNVSNDANLILARSAIKLKDFTSAQKAYQQVEKSANGKLKAEALYYKAWFKNKAKMYKASNTIIQKLASDYAAYRYFGAKGLVLMAQNFYGLKDAYQATYILESVLKNFTDYDDVISQAQTLLDKIKANEAKTNTSIKQ